MTDFVATKAITVHNTVEEAVAALETALEAVANTQVIRTCSVVRIEANKYAAILVHTAAV
jgi:hypothetical protein